MKKKITKMTRNKENWSHFNRRPTAENSLKHCDTAAVILRGSRIFG